MQPNVEALEQAVDELKKQYLESRNKGRSGQNTPPSVTTVDRNNGSHNAWGGFISRALPATTDGKQLPNKRSHSRSRSRSRSHSPNDDSRSRARKKSRHRSRSPAKYKKKSRNYSRSPSSSPHSKHKKRYLNSPVKCKVIAEIKNIHFFSEKVQHVKRITIRMVIARETKTETRIQIGLKIVPEIVNDRNTSDIIQEVVIDQQNIVIDQEIANDKR